MTDWDNALRINFELLIGYLVAYVPQVLGALILIIVGWGIAWIFSRLVLTLISFIGQLLTKASTALSMEKTINLKPQYAKVVSRVSFWVIMVFFFAAALSSLGVDFIATWLRELLGYLPNIIAGAIIGIGGFVIGNLAQTMTQAATHSAGIQYSNRIALLVKWMIVAVAIVIGIEQLGMNIQFVTTLLIVELAIFSFGIALAYGLGSHELVKNLVGSRQASKHLNVGEYIKIAGFEGKVISFMPSSLELETQSGRVLIPAKLYTENPCEVLSEIPPENIPKD